MKRKIFLVALIIATLCVTLTACMNNNGGSAQPTPTASANFLPDASDNAGNGVNNGNTADRTGGALGAFDWTNGAADIEKNIGQISEISECRVVVVDTTALAGVKFANVYKGELTERIREMVAAEILKADPNIQTVAVTSDSEDVARIYTLSDQIRSGRTADELSAEINEIVRNATTLR